MLVLFPTKDKTDNNHSFPSVKGGHTDAPLNYKMQANLMWCF